MAETIVKRLVIRASNSYDLSNSQIVPINCNKPIEIESEIGVFKLIINIRDFDGAQPHTANSRYNLKDEKFLNNEPSEKIEVTNIDHFNPNLRFNINFKPKCPIKGSDLIFGNDFLVPIRDQIPTTLLSTGLKFFTWFINKTVKGDVYSDKPFIYGLALNSFSFVSINNTHAKNILDQNDSTFNDRPIGESTDRLNLTENLNENIDNILKIPTKSLDRKKFFTNISNCEDFVFNDSASYIFQFDTNYLKLGDSKYAVSIPTYGNKTFDLNVSSYANEVLDNFNWTIKLGGIDAVGLGKLGLIINFALLDEAD